MEIKVLMLGGYQCGKTSALASMFEQVVYGSLRNVLEMQDRTVCENNYERQQITLCDKKKEMLHALMKSDNQIFMINTDPSYVQTYIFEIKTLIERKSLTINFTDIPGSMLSSYFQHKMIQNSVRESDVIIIGIDTPYLMECDERIAMGVNRIYEITEIIQKVYFDCNEAKSSKMVIFMPVKCEKWVKENKVDEVNDRIKNLYSPLINILSDSKYVSVCIIPIQTIGNIEFAEMRDPYIIRNENNGIENRCSKIDDKVVRLSSGEIYITKDNDCIYKDSSATLYSSEIFKPNAWYMKSKRPILSSDGYNPQNCDQLLLHILRFGARKVLSIPMLFGRIPVGGTKQANAYMSLLLNNPDLIKDNVEGIEYIH